MSEELKPCTHRELTIRETGQWVTEHFREKDGKWWSNNEPGLYGLMLEITCRSCAKKWKYSRSNAPKWLREAFGEYSPGFFHNPKEEGDE